MILKFIKSFFSTKNENSQSVAPQIQTSSLFIEQSGSILQLRYQRTESKCKEHWEYHGMTPPINNCNICWEYYSQKCKSR